MRRGRPPGGRIGRSSRGSCRWRDWTRVLRARFRCVAARRGHGGLVYLLPRTAIDRSTRFVGIRHMACTLQLSIRPVFQTCFTLARGERESSRARGRGERVGFGWRNPTFPAARVRQGNRTAISPGQRVSMPPAAVDDPSQTQSQSQSRTAVIQTTRESRSLGGYRWRRLGPPGTTDLRSSGPDAVRRIHNVLTERLVLFTRELGRSRQREENRTGGRIEPTLRKSTLPSPAPSEPVTKETLTLSAPRSQPAAFRRDRVQFEGQPPDVQTIAEHVMRQIDHRLSAWRERTGRV